MLSNPDLRIPQCAEQAIRSFRDALLLMGGPVLELEIPFNDGIRLPGYLFLPWEAKRLLLSSTMKDSDKKAEKIPVLVNLGGADSTKEELYFLFVIQDLSRDMWC